MAQGAAMKTVMLVKNIKDLIVEIKDDYYTEADYQTWLQI